MSCSHGHAGLIDALRGYLVRCNLKPFLYSTTDLFVRKVELLLLMISFSSQGNLNFFLFIIHTAAKELWYLCDFTLLCPYLNFETLEALCQGKERIECTSILLP
ncbi:hypothetical protein SAY87_023686 [Trapa incisa]|uniref:Uncharacterized protein n=1 Tax=Trapa incisa TaxID=236973 RepID=A0AAN7KZ87_9MYRT|nr:hypothetical protein SAY87_023686 [Trapa incisa]